ncbi:hypothetical protein [Paenibacillus sp. LHD-38]|uniref:hypothetical protein n=1 Tax=Paenibacillus sp. LHD-38 TaxID=3072143 RepID=UPI00280D2271|nr:hypothetical protein [Paenibacillus sp. LHD-38]MDQ8734613.1 hypothetical protein [Paenibacillus sp. LHD-38]
MLPTGSRDTATAYSQEWESFIWQITPNQQQDYKILDENQFTALSAKEQKIVIGKTSDFLAHRSSWEALDNLVAGSSEDAYLSWSKWQYY